MLKSKGTSTIPRGTKVFRGNFMLTSLDDGNLHSWISSKNSCLQLIINTNKEVKSWRKFENSIFKYVCWLYLNKKHKIERRMNFVWIWIQNRPRFRLRKRDFMLVLNRHNNSMLLQIFPIAVSKSHSGLRRTDHI